MATIQKYGIKYPFTANNNENVFLDTNSTYLEDIKSQVLHIIFTPKGQKIRDAEFGTNLIQYIFSPKDNMTIEAIKTEISSQIKKYIPDVTFRDIRIYDEENGIIVIVDYEISRGNKVEITSVGVKL